MSMATSAGNNDNEEKNNTTVVTQRGVNAPRFTTIPYGTEYGVMTLEPAFITTAEYVCTEYPTVCPVL